MIEQYIKPPIFGRLYSVRIVFIVLSFSDNTEF